MRFPSSDEALKEWLSVVDAVGAEVDRQLARAGRLRRAILQHAFEGRLVLQEAAAPSGDDGLNGASAPGEQLTLNV